MDYDDSYHHERSLFLYSILNYQSINDIPDVFIAPKVTQSKFHRNFLSLCKLTCLTCLGFLTYTNITYSEQKTSNKIIVLYIVAVNFTKNSKTEINSVIWFRSPLPGRCGP
jgi:hypothetical protein